MSASRMVILFAGFEMAVMGGDAELNGVVG